MRKILIYTSLFILLSSCAQTESTTTMIDNTPIKGFELERYLGTWYEIARFPHRFERDLQGVTATYSLKDNGKVKVVNAGFKDSIDGAEKTAVGKAKFAGDMETGHLKVSFFLFFYADYFIMKLDKENYQWALVGSSSSNFLWILSRKPVMDDSIYQELLEEARQRGYDLSTLEKVDQKYNP